MNVSFGMLMNTKDSNYLETPKQKQVQKLVQDAFIRTEIGSKSLDEFLDEEVLTDVYVKSKNNGNVFLRLRNSDDSDEKQEPKDVDTKKPLSVTLNLKKPMSSIKKAIDDFVKRSKKYAETKYGKENMDEYLTHSSYAKAYARALVDPEYKKALDALSEEEDFVRDFGTDNFN